MLELKFYDLGFVYMSFFGFVCGELVFNLGGKLGLDLNSLRDVVV